MKNLSKITLFAALVLASLGWHACTSDWRDAELAEHTADYAFPLFNTDLFFKDLIVNVLNEENLTDTLIFNADNTMRLIYSGDVAEKRADSLFAFTVQDLPAPILDTLFYAPLPIQDSIEFTKAVASGGRIFVSARNYGSEDITYTFTIPQFTKNGVPFTWRDTVPKNTINFNVVASPPIPIDGYTLLLGPKNSIYCKYDARLPNGNRVLMTSPNPIFPGLAIAIQGFKFSYVEGYWKNQVYPLDQDTIDIDINAANLRGNITIKDPKVTVNVTNSFGFPTRGVLDLLRFYDKDGKAYDLQSQIAKDGIDFAYPPLTQVGKTAKSSFSFDGTNSNIAQIFNAQPVRMVYKMEGIANAEDDKTLIGFLTDSSFVRVGVTVDLLLEGSAQDFGADQTLPLDFGDFGSGSGSGNKLVDDIEDVEFKLVTENQMPVSTSLQIYFQNENGVTLDSLFQNGLTKIADAAEVNAQGFPAGTKRVETFIPMSKARFDVVRNAKQAFLKTFFTTTEDANGTAKTVKLLSTNSTKVKMGVRMRVKN